MLYAFQMRARALPSAMRHLLSVFSLFPPGQQLPVAAVVNIFAHIHKRSVEEACVLLKSLASACYVEVRGAFGCLLSGGNLALSAAVWE